MSIRIRTITSASDHEAIRRLRYDVYVTEHGYALDGIDHTARILADPWDPLSDVFGAFDGNVLVATARLTPVGALPPTDAARALYGVERFPIAEAQMGILGRLMVGASHRGSSVCVQLIAEAYRRARHLGMRIGFMDCTARQLPLYEALGCRRYREVVGDAQFGLNIPLAQILGDLDHLHAVRSPLRTTAALFDRDDELARWYAATFCEFLRPCSIRLMSDPDLQRFTRQPDGAQELPLFAGLQAPELRQLLKGSALVAVPGQINILPRGNRGTELYVLVEGEVALAICPEQNCCRPSTLVPGDFIGDGGFLLGKHAPHYAARTLSRCQLLSISAEHFETLSNKAPALATRFLRNLSGGLCRRVYAVRGHR